MIESRRRIPMESHGCPIPHTHDKLTEAYYFAHRAAEEYHMPLTFRFNVNACLTALRSTTDYLPVEGSPITGFNSWWPAEFERLRVDPLIRLVKEARDLVVHKEVLSTRSSAHVGIFRGRQLRLGLTVELDPFEPSLSILERIVPHMTGTFIDAEHAAIGEELGIQREWIADPLGPDEVIKTLFDAITRMEHAIIYVHKLAGDTSTTAVIKTPEADEYQVLRESDVDPSLPKKWGWEY